MPLERVTLVDLKTLGLKVVTELFESQLAVVVADLFDRPGDKSKRRVTLRLDLTPRVNQQGICDGAVGGWECYAEIPKQRTRDYGFAANPNGALFFRPDSPDEPNQTTFEDLAADGDA